jgi:hypothetical protein
MAVKVAAPPEPTPLRASAGDDPGEALIKEAKQRARRRRWSYGAAVVVVAIAAAAAFSTAGTSSPHRASAHDVPTPAVPLGAPLVEGLDRASTLLASWGQFGDGYVFFYADGRVVWYPGGGVFVDADGRVTWHPDGRDSFVDTDKETIWYPGRRARYPGTRVAPEGVFRDTVIERRLSPRGLDLLRAGKLDPKHLLRNWDHVDREGRIHWVRRLLYQRPELWAEPTARIYEPSKYAICPTSLSPGGSFGTTDALAQVLAPARALLDGRQHTYDPSIGTASWPRPDNTPAPHNTPAECFEVTAAEASALYQILDANGQIIHFSATTAQGWWDPPNELRGDEENLNVLIATPVFPHGQYIIFGG